MFHVTHLTTQEFKSHGDHLLVVLVFCNAMIFIELRKSRKDMASSRQVFNNQHQNGTTVLHTGLAQLRHLNSVRATSSTALDYKGKNFLKKKAP